MCLVPGWFAFFRPDNRTVEAMHESACMVAVGFGQPFVGG
jgi:hypothetical protein